MKIKRLHENAILPTQGTPGSAGYDLYACLDNKNDFVVVQPGETVLIHTGLAIQMRPGMVGLIYARSGAAIKHGLRPANCVGVIDWDYRGEYIVALHNDSAEPQWIHYGDRIAQLMFTTYINEEWEETDELDQTQRNDGGFGSTGR
jgi:dUTP pyrophosphatase